MYLAIDTSTDTASLALIQDERALADLSWYCAQNHSTQLLPNLSHLLSQASLELKAINGIIVAQGPGSYNGLRVGISSLETEAYQHAETNLTICPIFNAGRGEIATAIYQKKRNKWLKLVTEHITTVDTLCSQITGKTIFCGEFIPVITTQLRKRLKQKALIPSAVTSLRRASFLAELGLKRFKAGDYDNPATLQPLYLRRPAITKPKHR